MTRQCHITAAPFPPDLGIPGMGLGAFYHWIHRLVDSWLIGLFLVRLGRHLSAAARTRQFSLLLRQDCVGLRSRPGGGRFGIWSR